MDKVVSFYHSNPKTAIFIHAFQVDPCGMRDAGRLPRRARVGAMSDETTSPQTRWEQQVVGERWTFYADRFERMHADGTDMEGEARLIDAMAPRGAAVLDAGCGTGRIAAALHRMGHRAIGVDKDAGLVRLAQSRYEGVPFLARDLLLLHRDVLVAAGGPATFDLIVLPGNVVVYLAPGTERDVLGVLAGLLEPAGRIVAGFATDREYSPADFRTDAQALGLTVEHQFATWDLDPYTETSDWVVTVLRRPVAPGDGLDQASSTNWGRPDDWTADDQSQE